MDSVIESLYGLGHDSAQLIVVKGKVDGKVCNDVLIDPGASSNFVRRDWVESQGLREQSLRTPLNVKLADDQVVNRRMGGVAVKSMTTQGSSAPCTLVVMEQLAHQVILGLPWLKRAGVVVTYGDVIHWNDRPLFPLTLAEEDEGQPQLYGVKVAPDHEQVMKELLTKYQRAFSKDLPRRTHVMNKNAIQCRITLKDPNCQPVRSKQRRRSPKDTQTLIGCVREMEAAGLIQKSESPWSSQPVLVRKVRDGIVLDEKRPCWDYRWVNELIFGDAYSLPLPEDMFDKLQGCRLFSKLDLTKGFWQIPLDEASKKILAMDTPLGLYEPNSMPFGMKNAPAVFQREMQRVLKDRLYQGVMVFIDDILIYSKTAEEHAELVEWVLRRLRRRVITLTPTSASSSSTRCRSWGMWSVSAAWLCSSTRCERSLSGRSHAIRRTCGPSSASRAIIVSSSPATVTSRRR